MKKWDLLLAHIYKNIPGFGVMHKEDSRLMRLLAPWKNWVCSERARKSCTAV